MFEPTGDRLVVRKDPKPEFSDGGIILAPGSQATYVPDSGTVVSVGPGLKNADGDPVGLGDIEVGSRVIVKRGGGIEMKIDGEILTVMNETDVLGIITE